MKSTIQLTGNISNMDPLIGIIVPVYNTAKYLKECLNSIKNQTYNNYVCIVVDDGSTDNSFDIANEYLNNSNLKKFLIFNKQNGGVSSARNFALNILEKFNITPEYICFVDSDDIIKPTFIETFIKHLEKNKADYAVCGYDEFDKNGVIQNKRRKTSKEILNQFQILEHFFAVKNFGVGKGMPFKYRDTTYIWGLCNKCLKYSNIKSIRFDENLRNCEDMKYFLEASQYLQKGIIIPEELYLYRMRIGSLVHNKEFDYHSKINNYQVLTNALNTTLSIHVKEILTICLCRTCYDCLFKAIEYKHYTAAKKFFFEFKNFIKILSKQDIEGELHKKLKRSRYGYILNHLYIKYKIFKKKRRVSFKANNYFS